MRKEAMLFGMIVVLFAMLNLSAVFAQLQIPDELAEFYSNDVSTLTVSNASLLLYSEDDREILYYLYYNPLNSTLNLTISIVCISSNCPENSQLMFDYMQNDETYPHVKKAAGIFVLTNGSDLGKYDYTLVVSDDNFNYSQNAQFSITVISSSFWTQFWHNLLNIFG